MNPINDGDLFVLQQNYLAAHGKFKPLQRVGSSDIKFNDLFDQENFNLKNTVAEQSIALKHSLPQILGSCAYINKQATQSSQSSQSK